MQSPCTSFFTFGTKTGQVSNSASSWQPALENVETPFSSLCLCAFKVPFNVGNGCWFFTSGNNQDRLKSRCLSTEGEMIERNRTERIILLAPRQGRCRAGAGKGRTLGRTALGSPPLRNLSVVGCCRKLRTPSFPHLFPSPYMLSSYIRLVQNNCGVWN